MITVTHYCAIHALFTARRTLTRSLANFSSFRRLLFVLLRAWTCWYFVGEVLFGFVHILLCLNSKDRSTRTRKWKDMERKLTYIFFIFVTILPFVPYCKIRSLFWSERKLKPAMRVAWRICDLILIAYLISNALSTCSIKISRVRRLANFRLYFGFQDAWFCLLKRDIFMLQSGMSYKILSTTLAPLPRMNDVNIMV